MKPRTHFFMTSIKKPLLLFFSAYVLFSVLAIALDPDRVTPSRTCAICFLNNSLSSSLNQVHVLPTIDLTRQYEVLIEKTCSFTCSVVFTDTPYRGPPRPDIVLS